MNKKEEKELISMVKDLVHKVGSLEKENANLKSTLEKVELKMTNEIQSLKAKGTKHSEGTGVITAHISSDVKKYFEKKEREEGY